METCCGYWYDAHSRGVSLDFHGASGALRTRPRPRSAGCALLRRPSRFRSRARRQEEKKTRPGTPAAVSSNPAVAAARCARAGILAGFPFAACTLCIPAVKRRLRIGSPGSNCCSPGTLPHFSLQSSRLNICYYHQDLHRRPFQTRSPAVLVHDRRALLLHTAYTPRCAPRIGGALQRHPFSGLLHSAGES